jgi:putative phosphoesterase
MAEDLPVDGLWHIGWMRILVVSDIHGNIEALSRIPEGFDRVLCLGDLVDYGPEPASCIAWVHERAALAVRGNHDHAVASRVDCRCAPVMREASERTRELVWKCLGADQLGYLAARPLTADIELDGVRIRMVHATPSEPLHRYLHPSEEEPWKTEVAPLEADIVLVGHTHVPMMLRVGDKIVLNPGSVGLPSDGDSRAAYAIIEDGVPRLERVEYDVEATVSRLDRRSLPATVVEKLGHLLRTGGARI